MIISVFSKKINRLNMSIVQKIFNFFPPCKGKLRLASLLFSKKNSRDFRTPNGIYFSVPNLQETVSFELFVNGVYEKDTIEFICNSIPKTAFLLMWVQT